MDRDQDPMDTSAIDARLLAASDLTFTSLDDSFLANLSASATALGEDDQAWAAIDRWLSELYAEHGEQPPAVTRTPAMLRTLEDLMRLNLIRDALRRTEASNAIRHYTEYQIEVARMKRTLEAAGLDANRLSPSTKAYLQIIARVCQRLALRAATPSCFLSALCDLSQREFDLQSRHARLVAEVDVLCKRRQTATAELNRWKDILATKQAQKEETEHFISEWERNATVLAQKAGEYESRAVRHNAAYDATGVVQEQLRVRDILMLEQKVRDLRARLAQTKRQLRGYHDLPPDLTLARLKLQEARERLERVHKQRHDALAGIVDGFQ